MRATVWRRPGSRGAVELGVRAATTLALLGLLWLLLAIGARNRWEWGRILGPGGWLPHLLEGLLTTLLISLGAMAVGLVLGFAGGIARLSRRPAVHQVATVYVEVMRGTPFLVQVFVAYWCVSPAVAGLLESAGAPRGLVELAQDKVLVGVLALGAISGAYLTEIVRAAIQSVDRGQTEAAVSQGMTRSQVLRWILLPQALRRMLPPMTGELATLVKDSSLLYVIGVSELTKHAYDAYNDTSKSFEVFLPLAVLYLSITFPLSLLSRGLERRLA
jgi:polar amino acid transport system permease protein